MSGITRRLNEIDKIFYHLGKTGKRSNDINIHLELLIQGINQNDLFKGCERFLHQEEWFLMGGRDINTDTPIMFNNQNYHWITQPVEFGNHLIIIRLGNKGNNKSIISITVPHFLGDSRTPCHVMRRIIELSKGCNKPIKNPKKVRFRDLYMDNVKGAGNIIKTLGVEIREIELNMGRTSGKGRKLALLNIKINKDTMFSLSKARRKYRLARPELIQAIISHVLLNTFRETSNGIHNMIFDLPDENFTMNNRFRSVPFKGSTESLSENVEAVRKLRDDYISPDSRYAFLIRALFLSVPGNGFLIRTLVPLMMGSVNHYISYINLNPRLSYLMDSFGDVEIFDPWMNMRPVGSAVSNVAISEFNGEAIISICWDIQKGPQDAGTLLQKNLMNDIDMVGRQIDG